MIEIVRSNGRWELFAGDTRIGTCVGTAHDAARAFCSNWPDLADAIESALCLDMCGDAPQAQRAARQVGSGPRLAGARRVGVGARMRELLQSGVGDADVLARARAEFPDSKATLSDVAWNKAELRKKPSAYNADGSKRKGI